MQAIAIDTHAAVKNLIGAGASPKLAEAIVDQIGRGQTELTTKLTAELATKADLADLTLEVAKLETRIETRISEEGRRTTRINALCVGLATAVLGTLIGLMPLIERMP
ncbi:MAG: hypothetical protein ACR2P7_05275 [bacterium]